MQHCFLISIQDAFFQNGEKKQLLPFKTYQIIGQTQFEIPVVRLKIKTIIDHTI